MKTYRWMIAAAGDAPGCHTMEEPESRITATDTEAAEEEYRQLIADGVIDPDGVIEELAADRED